MEFDFDDDDNIASAPAARPPTPPPGLKTKRPPTPPPGLKAKRPPTPPPGLNKKRPPTPPPAEATGLLLEFDDDDDIVAAEAPPAKKARPAPSEPPTDAPFAPADAYDGSRPGYVFKKGDSGLGYYKDTVPAKPKKKKKARPSRGRSGRMPSSNERLGYARGKKKVKRDFDVEEYKEPKWSAHAFFVQNEIDSKEELIDFILAYKKRAHRGPFEAKHASWYPRASKYEAEDFLRLLDNKNTADTYKALCQGSTWNIASLLEFLGYEEGEDPATLAKNAAATLKRTGAKMESMLPVNMLAIDQFDELDPCYGLDLAESNDFQVFHEVPVLESGKKSTRKEVLRTLRQDMAEQSGPYKQRPACQTFVRWVELAGKRVRGTRRPPASAERQAEAAIAVQRIVRGNTARRLHGTEGLADRVNKARRWRARMAVTWKPVGDAFGKLGSTAAMVTMRARALLFGKSSGSSGSTSSCGFIPAICT